MIEVENLTVNYGQVAALWDVTLSIPSGKLVGIVGPNGAGKSTFLKAAMDLISPLSGGVTYFGQSYGKVRKQIAYVPQRETIDWDFPITVIEVVLMGRAGKLGLFRFPRKSDREAAMKALTLVGMGSFADCQIGELSGGQQQRVFIARALLQDADIYLLDEPFAGIDATSGKVITNILQDLRDQGKTLLVVHHDLNTVKGTFDWVILLNMRLIAAGPVSDVFHLENVKRAYGEGGDLFEELFKRSQAKTSGVS